MNKQRNEWMSCFTMICGMHGLVGCLTKKRFAYAFPAYMALKRHAYSTLYISKNTEDGRDDHSPRTSERNVWKVPIL